MALLPISAFVLTLLAFVTRFSGVTSDACFCNTPGSIFLPDAVTPEGKLCSEEFSFFTQNAPLAQPPTPQAVYDGSYQQTCAARIGNISARDPAAGLWNSWVSRLEFQTACCEIPLGPDAAFPGYYGNTCPLLTGYAESKLVSGGLAPEFYYEIVSIAANATCEKALDLATTVTVDKSNPFVPNPPRAFCTSLNSAADILNYNQYERRVYSDIACGEFSSPEGCNPAQFSAGSAVCEAAKLEDRTCQWTPDGAGGGTCGVPPHFESPGFYLYAQSTWAQFAGAQDCNIDSESICRITTIALPHCKGAGITDVNGNCANVDPGTGCSSSSYELMGTCSWQGADLEANVAPVYDACCTKAPRTSAPTVPPTTVAPTADPAVVRKKLIDHLVAVQYGPDCPCCNFQKAVADWRVKGEGLMEVESRANAQLCDPPATAPTAAPTGAPSAVAGPSPSGGDSTAPSPSSSTAAPTERPAPTGAPSSSGSGSMSPTVAPSPPN